MIDMDTTRIAERFAKLPVKQRQAVYEKIRSQGLGMGQFPIPVRNDEAGVVYPLSYAQMRQWFLWQLEPRSTAYHIAGALTLRGELSVDALKAGFTAVVARHETLRTVFRTDEEGRVEQYIASELKPDIVLRDLTTVDAGVRQRRVRAKAQYLCETPFDLTQGPLLRVGLIRMDVEEHILVVVIHHIVSDGWSMQILIDEFVAQYRAHVKGDIAQLPALPIQYADYTVWQRQWLEAGEKDRQLAYWRSHLGEEHPILSLPTDHARRADGRYSTAHYSIELPRGLVQRLHQRAREEEATLFMVLLAGFQVLLHYYTGQRDIRVGVPIANRHRVETEGLIGFFVNTQVLRNVIDGRVSLRGALSHAKEAALGAQSHQDLPFEQLVEALQPERSLSGTPLFQVVYNHLRGDSGALHTLPGLTLEEYPLEAQAAQFELALNTNEDMQGRVRANFAYARELFESESIEQMVGHYLAILEALAENPARHVLEIDLLSDEERSRLRQWGTNNTHYDETVPVHTLFERQVVEQPDATALLFNNEQLSYAELNRRANQLAHHLIHLGVKPETKVGIALERSLDLVVGLLGILKAGGAYVPLDPEYPRDRLTYLMEDSGVERLLTHSTLRQRFSVSDSITAIEIDNIDLREVPHHNPEVPLSTENLAYVIYTSGSTGKPKGAANRHASLANCMLWMQDVYGLKTSDTVLHKAPFGFDVSIWELFWPLTTGARLAIARPGDHRDPVRISALIRQHDVTTLNFVPVMLQAFLAQAGIEHNTRLKHIICGGESMPAATQREALSRLRDVTLQNLYGPTEAAIHVTRWTCRHEDRHQVPIGRPLSGICTRVLDESLNEVPPGVAGELYLGGVGLARGYLHRAALTAERFVADPHDSRGERLYRTGDLVRWNREGQLEYLGRLDHQVKIRGFRIELGEVEAQLLAQPEVREAVVVAREGVGGTRLVGYIAPQSAQHIDSATLRERLGKALPDYMVPSIIVTLDTLPLNPNGKVDRKALPVPELDNERIYEAPQGDTEEMLANLWAEVLGVERVGRNDNFFELGGDSIIALQIIARLEKTAVDINLRDLITRPSIAELSKSSVEKPIRDSVMQAMNAVLGDVAPLFCFHSGVGTVFAYQPLARWFNGVCTLYGLTNRMLLDPNHMDTSLQAMAYDYSQMLQRIQPKGPYRLLGWSLGGTVAALVAHELERQNLRVQCLILADPYVPNTPQDEGKGWVDRLAEYASKALPGMSPQQVKALIPPGARETAAYIVPLFERLLLLRKDQTQENQAHTDAPPAFDYMGAEDLGRAYLASSRLRSLALQVGGLPPTRARPECWWTSHRPRSHIDELFRQWNSYDLTSNTVDSNHLDMLNDSVFRSSLRTLLED